MAGLSPPPADALDRARTNRAMFDRIAGRYDLLNRVLTLGLDAGWRRRTVAALGLTPGSFVLDLACGTGDLCREAERAGMRCVGVDAAAGMLAHSHTEAPLLRADILRLPLRGGTVDGAVCGFALRNVVDIPACLRETARVLRPGGRIGFLEVAEPSSALLRRGHALWFRRVVPAVGGLLSDREAYRYLPASAAWLPPPAELVAILREAGFVDVERRGLGGGAAQLLTGTRAGGR